MSRIPRAAPLVNRYLNRISLAPAANLTYPLVLLARAASTVFPRLSRIIHRLSMWGRTYIFSMNVIT